MLSEARHLYDYLRECFLSPNSGKKRALTTENTESTEVFLRFFSVIFVISVVEKPLRNSLSWILRAVYPEYVEGLRATNANSSAPTLMGVDDVEVKGTAFFLPQLTL